MLTLIAFLISFAGSINWLLIGLLQYDFIAGFFGFQASLFSRLFYISFGVSALYLLIRVIANKGSVKIFERKRKKDYYDSDMPTAQQNSFEDKWFCLTFSTLKVMLLLIGENYGYTRDYGRFWRK